MVRQGEEVLIAKLVVFHWESSHSLALITTENSEQAKFGPFSMQILSWGSCTGMCCIFSMQWVAGLI